MIELMIAILISSLLLIGVLDLFINTNSADRSNTALNRTQESGRILLDIIGTDGCGVVPGFGAGIGAVDEDMGNALQLALTARPDDCVTYARQFSWEACLDQFLSALQPPAFAQVA